MDLREAALLTRITFFAGVVLLAIGLVVGRDVLISTSGLLILGGVLGTAVVAHAHRRP